MKLGEIFGSRQSDAPGLINQRLVFLLTIVAAGAGAWVMLPEPSGAEHAPVAAVFPLTGPAENLQLAQAATVSLEAGSATSPEPDSTPPTGALPDMNSTAAVSPDATHTVERSPLDGLKIASQSWRRGGLGSKALVTLTLRNANDYAVKDVEIACAFARRDGSHLTERRRLISDTIGMKSKKTYARMLVGFVNIHASKAKCSLVTASRV